MSLPADTQLGSITLRAADVERLRAFYEETIGLRATDGGDGGVALGVDGTPLVEFAHDPDAPPRPHRSTGLFHLALLVPERADLARALRRVVGSGWRLTGASDHLVSEALYLADPEDNGIELYRDRPRGEWPVAGGTSRWTPAARPAEPPCRGGDDEPDLGMPAARRSATSTSRSPTSPPPSASGRVRSASTSPSAATPARCSSRRAATTTTSD